MRVLRKGTRVSMKRKFDVSDSSNVGKSPKKARSRRSSDDDVTDAKPIITLKQVKLKEEVTDETKDSDEEEVADNDDHDQGLSSYEIERLANIQKNENFFKELNLNEAKISFQESTGKSSNISKPEKYGLKREKKEKEPPTERRVSMRIRRMDPMGLPLPDLPEQQQNLSEQFRRVPYYMKSTQRIGLHSVEIKDRNIESRMRKSAEPLEMVSYNKIDSETCKKVITEWSDAVNKATMKKIAAKSRETTFDLNGYKKGIQSLSIADNHAAKVTPERIFALAIHPMESKLLVFAGDKWGKVGVRELDSKEGDDGVFLFEPHTRPINVLSFDPFDSTKILSCSYDGTIRCGDMQKQQFIQIYETPEEDDVLINAFAWRAKSNSSLMVAKNDYTVGLVDVRTGKEESNFVAHAKSVRWIDCHPFNENLLVTTCQDGSVATWDIRKTKGIKSKLSEARCSRVASSAFFSPQTGNKILVTSLDDTIRVYDVNNNGSLEIPPKCTIRHNNQTGRWLTKFRAVWDPKTDNCFVVGSMSRPRAIDFYNSDGKGSLITQMSHENLTSITSLNVFHPTLNVVAGGNSSGKVFAWK